MRSFVVTMAVCALLATGFAANALAVGVYVAGKEDCKCSPLVAAGIVPDMLNTLAAMPFWRVLNGVAERLAAGVHAMLNQTGGAPTLAAAGPETPPSIAPAEKKPVAKPKKATKKTKARKVKRPPTAK